MQLITKISETKLRCFEVILTPTTTTTTTTPTTTTFICNEFRGLHYMNPFSGKENNCGDRNVEIEKM